MLNVINGFYHADCADVFSEGAHFEAIHPLCAARLGIGHAFRHNALFRRMSVLDNVLTRLTRHSRTTSIEHAFGVGRDAGGARTFRACADEIIEFLELQSFPDAVVATLPYGIKKWISPARSLGLRPWFCSTS